MDTQFMELFGKFYDALFFAGQSKVVIEEVGKLLPYADVPGVPENAIRMLDTLNLPLSPKYGEELTTAAVLLLKAYFHLARDDEFMASICIEAILNIPKWRVLYGRKTLDEIMEEAQWFKDNYL